MRINGVPSATHNIYAYRFVSTDGTIHEGFDNDGEHGEGRQQLSTLTDNEVKTRSWSCWYGSNIRQRRFAHRQVLVPQRNYPCLCIILASQLVSPYICKNSSYETSDFIISKVYMYKKSIINEYYMLNKYVSKGWMFEKLLTIRVYKFSLLFILFCNTLDSYYTRGVN